MEKKFYSWFEKNIDSKTYRKAVRHGLIRFWRAAHTRFMWETRTNPTILKIFKQLYRCDELICGFDTFCYMLSSHNGKDNLNWLHIDLTKLPSANCYQCFLALTDNDSSTFVAVPGSHKHTDKLLSSGIRAAHWTNISQDQIESIGCRPEIVSVKAGDLVIWDSRMVHANQYGIIKEERLVLYLSYMRRDDVKNTEKMRDKRWKYFITGRTTTHVASPINVLPTKGRNNNLNYDGEPDDLDDILEKIKELTIH